METKEIEEIEEGSPVRLALKPVGNHRPEEFFRLVQASQGFEESRRGEVAPALRIRPRMAGAQGLRGLERLKRPAGLAHLDQAFGADALREPAQLSLIDREEI